jgi:hypothetical protein
VTQQINLYHPIFRKQEKRFSALTMAQATGVVLAAIVVLSGWQWWQVHKLQTKLDQLNQRYGDIQKKSRQLTAILNARARGTAVLDEASQIKRLIDARAQVRQLLGSPDFSNTRGYSEMMTALARQHLAGMWLTGFRIVDAGQGVSLAGRSYNPELVPKYIGRLSNESSLRGIRFELFQMSRPKSEKTGQAANYVEFVATTKPELESRK